MCIGIPMKVIDTHGGAAVVEGRGRVERIDVRLVDDCAPGDWLLVFQGAARERLHPAQAAEIDAALDLLEAALGGGYDHDPQADPGFALPSAMSAAQLAALTGQATAPAHDSMNEDPQ